LRVVVCEDDPSTRATIGVLAEEHHHVVIAETDNAVDAIALVKRFGAHAVILDLALASGPGEELLDELRADHTACSVVVFSVYCHDFTATPPVVAIVEKPDFEKLAVVLADLPRLAGATTDRRQRQPPPAVHARPAGAVSDAASDFYAVLADARPGDALIMLRPPDPTVSGDATAAALRHTLRVQDWLLVESQRLVVLLVGGNPPASQAVKKRLPAVVADWPTAEAILDGHEPPGDTLLRLRDSLS
jgi:CheY-like chemotaxis protein